MELKSNVNFFNQSKSQETFVYSYACNIFFCLMLDQQTPIKLKKRINKNMDVSWF